MWNYLGVKQLGENIWPALDAQGLQGADCAIVKRKIKQMLML